MPFHGRSTSATTAISGKLALRLIAVLGCTALGTVLFNRQLTMTSYGTIIRDELVYFVAFRVC